jgi:hypothetical protein
MRIAIIMLAAVLMPLWAQEIKLPANLERLSAKAEETVDVTLDSSMLRLASRFLSDNDHDQAKVKKLITGLESVYVRSFEFAEEGDYSVADVDTVRAQLQAPTWLRIVGVRSTRHGDNVDVYFKSAGNGQFGGIVVIAAEPRELTFVNIIGTLDPAQLSDLGGEFHIPRLDMTGRDMIWKESK